MKVGNLVQIYDEFRGSRTLFTDEGGYAGTFHRGQVGLIVDLADELSQLSRHPHTKLIVGNSIGWFRSEWLRVIE